MHSEDDHVSRFSTNTMQVSYAFVYVQFFMTGILKEGSGDPAVVWNP